MSDITVTLNAPADRYEIVVDGQVAGFAAIMESDTHVAFTHTEVDEAYAGQGLGSRLAHDALTDATERGKRIIPLCPYIERYLQRHEIPGVSVEWPNRAPDA